MISEEVRHHWFHKTVTALLLLFSVCCLSGCGAIMKSATQPVIDNLTTAVMKQQDLELVKDGAPAFLLIADGLVEGSPDDPDILIAAANLYSSYISVFIADEDQKRAKILTAHAKDYAFRAMSIENKVFAKVWDKPFNKFEEVLPTIKKGDEEILFLIISTWAAYIVANQDKMDNLADIPKIKALAEKMLEMDEGYFYGSPHLAMGTLKTLIPPALGGKPEEGRTHFQKAIEISGGNFLPAKVMFAQKYAKLVFDRQLHDRLCNEVMETPVDIVPELTLINTYAKKQAQKLLDEADEYF